MSQENIMPASAINLAEISARPAKALAALIEFVRLQGEVIKTIQARESVIQYLTLDFKYCRPKGFSPDPFNTSSPV